MNESHNPKPGVLRTPDDCFENLPDYPFEANYVDVDDLRVHYLDEGPKFADPILLMHGEPSWSYLYRKMIPGLVAAGHRCIAPDLIGFGKSDKLTSRKDYSYQFHIDTMEGFVKGIDLKNITLFCQDWGSLHGLARVLSEDRSLSSWKNHQWSLCIRSFRRSDCCLQYPVSTRRVQRRC